MADNDIQVGPDLASAASAIDRILNPQAKETPTPAAAKAADPAPARDEPEQPDSTNSTDSDTRTDSVDTQTASDDKSSAVDTAAPKVETPARQTAIPPDVEQMRTDAAKKFQEAESARSQFINQLNVYIPQLESALRGEFADIKTQEDVLKLAETDVARYNRFQIQQMRLSNATHARNQAQQVEQSQMQERLTQWRQAEGDKIGSLIPELKDPNKGPSLARKLNEFALKQGYSAEQLSRASAADFKVLHRAMQADDLEASIAAAKVKASKAPAVQEPGTRQSNSSKDQKTQTAFARLQKNPRSTDAAADVFLNILNQG